MIIQTPKAGKKTAIRSKEEVPGQVGEKRVCKYGYKIEKMSMTTLFKQLSESVMLTRRHIRYQRLTVDSWSLEPRQ